MINCMAPRQMLDGLFIILFLSVVTELVTSMVDQELLDILVCPETKQPVRLAGSDLLDVLNRAIDAGAVKKRDGDLVEDRVEEGLVREDDGVLYPVRDSIPIMLIDEAIPLGDVLKTD